MIFTIKFVTHDSCTQHMMTVVINRTSCIMCLTCWIHHIQSKANEALVSLCISNSLPNHTKWSPDYPITIWSFNSSGAWWYIIGKVVPGILSSHSAFIFWVKHSKMIPRSWRWLHFKLSGIIHPTTHCHSPEDLNLQQHHLENLKTCISITYLKGLQANYALRGITQYNKCINVNACVIAYVNSMSLWLLLLNFIPCQVACDVSYILSTVSADNKSSGAPYSKAGQQLL